MVIRINQSFLEPSACRSVFTVDSDWAGLLCKAADAAANSRAIADVHRAAALGVGDIEADRRRTSLREHPSDQESEPAGPAGDDCDLALHVRHAALQVRRPSVAADPRPYPGCDQWLRRDGSHWWPKVRHARLEPSRLDPVRVGAGRHPGIAFASQDRKSVV